MSKKGTKQSIKRKPPIAIQTTELCGFGCGQVAQYQYRSGKLCCSRSYNSCPKKKQDFIDSQDHKENARKSLKTRTDLGITVSSQIKGGQTRVASGHYDRLKHRMQELWLERPWTSNGYCYSAKYESTDILYQGTYELEFLNILKEKNSIEWIEQNVKRGPSIWYRAVDGTDHVYVADFIIDNTIYEIKSYFTWNKLGKDNNLEQNNRLKLDSALNSGYNVVLVLEKQEIIYNGK